MDLRITLAAVAAGVCISPSVAAQGPKESPPTLAPLAQAGAALLPLAIGFTLFPKAGKEPEGEDEPDDSENLESLKAEITRLNAELNEFHNIQFASLVRYQAMFAELPLPCFTLNEEGHIMEWNNAAADLFGLSATEVADKPIKEILGKYFFFGRAEEAIYLVFMGYKPQPLEVLIEIGNERKSVTWFPSPVKEASGKVVGVVNTLAVVSSRELRQAATG